ncbi:piggyBac transposable element-derived protein 3-like [Cydia pomonella]|uniref:piggyBac transposable element-derived protein 3-like n=1 Tax=Cydia pomonella TaxID=82600 RepID=UPI002ADDAE10|nr:piggyBac transposable element-derived protein 3-like [Cydia pomonella]
MPSKRPLKKKALSFNEIIDNLHHLDSDDDLPNEITIFPPENPNTEVTDEDSGDEEFLSLHNLPGSQLRAPAEAIYSSYSENEDSEDDLSLSTLAKKMRTTTENSHENENEPSVSNPRISSTRLPNVLKSQQYKWVNQDNPRERRQWQDREEPKNRQSPMYYYECMMNDEIIELLVYYTNLYASQKNAVGNVTISEMKCFLGILLYSGYVSVPRRYMFWEKSSDTHFDIVYNDPKTCFVAYHTSV